MSSLTTEQRELAGRRYDTDDVERGLAAVALCNGSAARAASLLREQGYTYSDRTIQRWRQENLERYHEIRTDVVDRIRQEQAEEHVELGHLAMEGERQALALLLPQLKDLEGRDLSNAHRNLAVAAGIHAQRSGDLRGDASVIEHRSVGVSPEEYEAKLKRLGIQVVRVEAEDVETGEAIDAELVEADAEGVADVEAEPMADAPHSADSGDC